MRDYEIQNINTAEHYGFEAQSNQLMEECAELIQAVNKYKRACGIGKSTDMDKAMAEKHIIEEMADVEVMLQQVKHLLGINPKYVEGIKQQKIKRQMQRIERWSD